MTENRKKKVAVGMSGGVDSSVSAWLLQQQGYQVEGIFMKNWEEDDSNEYCAAAFDLADARKVCEALKIPIHTVNFSAEYWDKVFKNFLSEYQAGRTPNPDILCNKEIKFKTFLKFATDDLGADFIATGHYARCVKIGKKNQLLRGLDNNKDQSYFLYTLSHKKLARCLFPIGNLVKPEVRRIAAELGLVNAAKKDSMGICFIGKKKFRNFITRYLPENPGIIVAIDGKPMGHHKGLMYYTLGQRKGLGIGGTPEGNRDPWYVVDKDLNHNLLIVAQGHRHPKIMSDGFISSQAYWIDRIPLKKARYCTVKIRYRHPDINCVVTPQADGGVRVIFDKPVAAVTPGQSAVFYLAERCLGGLIIDSRH